MESDDVAAPAAGEADCSWTLHPASSRFRPPTPKTHLVRTAMRMEVDMAGRVVIDLGGCDVQMVLGSHREE